MLLSSRMSKLRWDSKQSLVLQLMQTPDPVFGASLHTLAVDQNAAQTRCCRSLHVIDENVSHVDGLVRPHPEPADGFYEDSPVRLFHTDIRGGRDRIEEPTKVHLGAEVVQATMPVRDHSQAQTFLLQRAQDRVNIRKQFETVRAEVVANGGSVEFILAGGFSCHL